MRAAVYQPGADAVGLTEVADPEPGPGQLIVRMRAAGLNRADLLMRRALSPGSKPIIGGAEVAGEIVAMDPTVDGWQIGDRVMGRGQGFAELVAVDADSAIDVPADMTWEEAGALPVALLTMHDALRTNGGLAPGHGVCINAATSGVGVVGVQLASLLGASLVVAISRSSEKLAVLEDFVGPLDSTLSLVDSSRQDVPSQVLDATGGKGVDLIIDNVGGTVLAANLAMTAVGGRIVQVGRLGGRTDTIDLDELARKRIALIGVTFRTRSHAEVVQVVRRCLADVGTGLMRCRPRVDRVFPLAEVKAAQAHMAGNHHVGKLVLVP